MVRTGVRTEERGKERKIAEKLFFPSSLHVAAAAAVKRGIAIEQGRLPSFLLVPLPTRKLRRKGTGVGGFRHKNWPAEKPPSQLNFGCRRKGLVLVESRAPQFSSSSSFPLRSPPPRAIDRGGKEGRREDINRPDAEMDRKWNLCFRFRFFTFPGVYAYFSAKKLTLAQSFHRIKTKSVLDRVMQKIGDHLLKKKSICRSGLLPHNTSHSFWRTRTVKKTILRHR